MPKTPHDDTGSTAPPDYEIGYGKPPQAHRFKPGESGNPSGRKKSSKSMGALVKDQLDSKVPVTIDGALRKMTKRKIIAHKLVTSAMQGNTKATKQVLDIDAQVCRDTVHDSEREELSPDDRRILELHVASLKNRTSGDSGEPG